MKITYYVSGLDCVEEVTLLKAALQHVVDELRFNLLQAKMVVSFDPQKITPAQIENLIRKAGFKATAWDKYHASFWGEWGRLIFTLLNGLAIGFALLLQNPIFYLLALFFGLWYIFPKAFFALRHLAFDMNLLMGVAIIGALLIGQWFEAASVSFLFSVALLLEHWSVAKASSAISSLMDLTPLTATLEDGREVALEEVEVGAKIIVKPGEKIPLDGKVVAGSSTLDQSTITGESSPIRKDLGDELFAGTLNQEGTLDMEVTARYDETLLARIINLVDQAKFKSSAAEQWVESFAKYYTPIMFLFALLVMILPPLLLSADWISWIYRGLVILVIACPCALVISTPVSIVSGLTSAARFGILIKEGRFLEEVGKISALAVDKTGTLTYGEPRVQRIIPLNGHTERELLERAVALERGSEHPLARAILSYAKDVETERATNFQLVKGKGASALYQGKLYWIGSHRYMHEVGEETEEIHRLALEMEDAGHSVVAIGTEDHVCGLISIVDEIREGMAETLEEIRKCGVSEIVMLTGDNEKTAQDVAALCNISYKAELLPEDKLHEIQNLRKRYERVTMVGDGVNDAPALAAATIGIAMGGGGSDVALEVSDIAFMADELSKLPWLLHHSQRVVRIIKQNIFFALGVKLLFVMLALSNLATLWMAIAADTGATLLVIANALRLCLIDKKC